MGGGYDPWNDAKRNCLITFGACCAGCIFAEYTFLLNHASEDARPRLKYFRLWLRLVWYATTSVTGLVLIILDLIDDPPKVENLDNPTNSYQRISFAFAIGGFFMYEIMCQAESRTCFNMVHHGGLIMTVLMMPEYYTVLVWFLALNESPGVVDLIGVMFLSKCGKCDTTAVCNACEIQKVKAMRLAMILRTCYLPISGIPLILLIAAHKGEFKIAPAMIVIGGVAVHWLYYGCYMSTLMPKLLAKEAATQAEATAGEEDPLMKSEAQSEWLLKSGFTKSEAENADDAWIRKSQALDDNPKDNFVLLEEEEKQESACSLGNLFKKVAVRQEPITDTWRKSAYQQHAEGSL